MKLFSSSILAVNAALAVMACTSSNSLAAADLVHAKDGSGVYGYKDTSKLPWCGHLVHDPDRPAPKRIHPGPAPAPAPAPADALVLFDGKDLSQWQHTEWKFLGSFTP